MNSRNFGPRRNNLVLIFVSILVLAGIAIYLLTNKSNSSFEIDNLTNKSQSNSPEPVLEQESELIDLNNLKIYLSIADNASDKVIRKTYSGVNYVNAKINVDNAPNAVGDCSIEVYKIEGVSANAIYTASFQVNQSIKQIDRNLNLNGGMFRVDINCDFGGKSYSQVYTLDLKLTNQTPTPSSYSI